MISFIVSGLDGTGSSSCHPMEGLTLARRPAIARVRALDGDAIARVAFALLCVGGVVGFLVYPTYPNYDSYYSLLWGREILDLQLPSFEGFRVPTEHPLAIAVGALVSLFGRHGDRLFIFLILASFLWLIWGVYRLGRIAFTPLVGVVAALLLLSRFDFAFLAARGYIDIPYLALVVWAVALEATRPRRGTPVFALLAAAGLRADAEARVRTDLVLEQVGKELGIEPSEEEVTDYMRSETEKDAELKSQFDRLSGMAAARDYFRHRLTRLKVLEALVARLGGNSQEAKAE
jgi:hypothetical protein